MIHGDISIKQPATYRVIQLENVYSKVSNYKIYYLAWGTGYPLWN